MRVRVQGDGALRSRIVAALEGAGLCVTDRAPVDATILITRSDPREEAEALQQVPGVTIDFAGGRVDVAGRSVRLTRHEWALLAALREAGAAGLDRAGLLRRVWNLGFDPGTNIVAVHVSRLRARIGRATILTEAGRYRLAGTSDAAARCKARGEDAMAKPPATPPSSDIEGVHMDSDAALPNRSPHPDPGGALKRADDESVAKPDEQP